MSARNPSNTNGKVGNKILKGCSAFIPFVEWIITYSKLDAIADLITGITIGLIIIPQSVAYVAIVGLSAKVGLLSSVIGGLFYTFFGTVKEISVGPTAMMSLLTDQYTNGMFIDNIGTLCFGCAIVGLTLTVFKLGIVVEFISIPVSSAFGSAVALTILASELKNFTGLNYKSNKFIESLEKFSHNIREMKMGDICLGIISTIMLILFDKLENVPISKSCKYGETIRKILWLTAMSKNAITLLMACFLTQYFERTFGTVPYKLSNPVTPGFPDFQAPWTDTKVNNVTTTFQERVQTLYSGMIIIPIVALLVHVSIAKFFDGSNTIRINHELFSMSMSNLLCSFFNSSPIAGAFSRSAVSSVCEVRTPISSFYAAVLAFLALTLLTPYFRLIPKASLSAVIITAVFSVIDYKILFVLWKNSKKDLFVLLCTLWIGLYFGIEVGLITGVLINLLFLIYLWARPSIEIKKCESEEGDYILVTPDLGLFYPAVSYLEAQMCKTLNKEPYKNLPVAVNCIFFKGFDYTAMKGLVRIIKLYQRQKCKIIFFNAHHQILTMCTEMDKSTAAHFFDNAEDYRLYLFSNYLESAVTKIDDEERAKKVNGACTTIITDNTI